MPDRFNPFLSHPLSGNPVLGSPVNDLPVAPLPIADLVVTATSLDTYMTCPRQYFYQHVLALPTPGKPAARAGQLIHQIFEAFNQQFAHRNPNGHSTHTAAQLLSTGQQLLSNWTQDLKGNHPEGSHSEGPHSGPFRLSVLEALLLKKRFEAIVANLSRQGYFEKPVIRILAEKSYSGIALAEFANTRFYFKIDALIEHPSSKHPNGEWTLLDYKLYGKGRFAGKKPETRQKELLNTFSPIPVQAQEHDRTHDERFLATSTLRRSYQLPLYYMAARQLDQLPIQQVGVQLLRPQEEGSGAVRVSIEAETLDAQLPGIVEDLKTHVLMPLRQMLSGQAPQVFPPNAGMSCRHCGFLSICDAAETDAEADLDEGKPEAVMPEAFLLEQRFE